MDSVVIAAEVPTAEVTKPHEHIEDNRALLPSQTLLIEGNAVMPDMVRFDFFLLLDAS